MHIGLIGGIGPAATDHYYRRLIKAFAGRAETLDLTIAHADAATLLAHLSTNDTAAQAAIFLGLTRRLAAAGAQVVAVTSIGGHFCIEDFKAVSPLPVIDLLSSVPDRLQKAGYRTVGILGTRTVMQSAMYGCLPMLRVLPPRDGFLDAVHQSYVDMATAGVVTEAQRQVFFDCGRDLCEGAGAEAVLLAGTDLFLAFDGRDPGFKAVDCALLHLEDLIEAAAR
ncbi:aspartate/glutamate racemase family protein [Pelagibius litoralis]|uniref:Aspartate/glutamate racemase family protein n=1 Tax=Pelagibius litoralis TaxID=374515 RepID=A0A967KH83_9PROT|nr:aspartate/glutamate racemase family protein [Pelagibius litoralis]NIA71011.1 aspartate/glutamate racemase family protein [Pelagibius litoralis]